MHERVVPCAHACLQQDTLERSQACICIPRFSAHRTTKVG